MMDKEYDIWVVAVTSIVLAVKLMPDAFSSPEGWLKNAENLSGICRELTPKANVNFRLGVTSHL